MIMLPLRAKRAENFGIFRSQNPLRINLRATWEVRCPKNFEGKKHKGDPYHFFGKKFPKGGAWPKYPLDTPMLGNCRLGAHILNKVSVAVENRF
mgnify:CR=1 FL=1